MNVPKPNVSSALVDEYIRSARKATTSIQEEIILSEARAFVPKRNYGAAGGGGGVKPSLRGFVMRQRARFAFREDELIVEPQLRTIVVRIKEAILKQLHIALCTRSKKYAKEVAALKDNIRLLIAAVAGYVAASFGLSSAVIAALVAAILRLILTMGVVIFCEEFSK